MNNLFNPSINVLGHNPIQQQQTQNVSEATGVESHMQSASVPNISYLQAHALNHQAQPLTAQQHLAAMTGTHPAPLFDPRQLQSLSGLDKTYYTGSSANIAANGTPAGRFFTAANSGGSHPNTILITNNFTPQLQQPAITTQQRHDQQRAAIANNLRLVSATTGGSMHQPQIFNAQNNIGKELTNADLLHLQQLPAGQQQQIYQHQLLQQQSQYAPHQQQLSALMPLQTASPHYAQGHFGQQHHTLQQFYTPTPVTSTNTGDVSSNVSKLMSTNASTSTIPPPSSMAAVATPANNSPTVVLDRINICINNHYSDAAASPAASSTSLSTTPSQQQSPIIPAIQHKAVVDTGNDLFIDPYASNESSSIVIDEPDSTTTTPHTPPTTPENNSLTISLSTLPTTTTQSPTTTTSSSKIILTPDNILTTAVGIEQSATNVQSADNCIYNSRELLQENPPNTSQAPPTPLTPPTPPTPPASTVPIIRQTLNDLLEFAIGEDVLIKRNDERFYLGTIIDINRVQYLVRFDDRSELWSTAAEMRKLNGGDKSQKGQMCVACKRSETADIVEVCERCGRGYHRNCTNETVEGSGIWICKRCAKPMKMLKKSICLDKISSVCRQLPYDVDSLNWDEKHRVNQEQIYCYCGQSGKFDDNMLQCCRCRNWFHTHCIQCFKKTILRGDGFFVFCCSVCNNGEEYLRRLQINWIDLLHLSLYNLSAIKKHQNQKYHHLIKDIWPFVLERRSTLPIPKSWTEMPEHEFKEKIKATLSSERFMCGKEIKKDPLYFALRSNGPPIIPEIKVKDNDLLTDEFLKNSLKLTLLEGAPENIPKVTTDTPLSELKSEEIPPITSQKNDVIPKNDVYEFHTEDEDEKFTSDDEIPIKHIMEKVKKSLSPEKPATSICQKKNTISNIKKNLDVNDFSNTSMQHSTQKTQPQKYEKEQNKNEINTNNVLQSNINKTEGKLDLPVKSSRKRKAFTLSKVYKESAAEVDTRICDSSSDENSSSSRGTSLDLIIPPPKNFLGLNNPFRMVTPKKNSSGGVAAGDKKTVTFARRGPHVKNSIFTTTSLDFSSKLAALKSSGIFSNLSSSELAKAAGQPRLVRTIKRRLSAKDITIGPNQEVRRRRIRRLSSNIEVISTTTINQIPSNFFPIHAKDLISSTVTNHKLSSSSSQHQTTTTATTNNNENCNTTPSSTTSSVSSCSVDYNISLAASTATVPPPKPLHGRRLRQRPEKNSPNNSRRSSISGASTSSNSSMLSTTAVAPTQTGSTILDLKQSVTKYFGAVNRIESGENFSIRAKRRLGNGQMQYLIEWGGDVTTTS